jgi:hypothetical protein
VSDTGPFKYRAFLSYSHANTGIATRVHRRLEGFHIDKDLVGRITPTGTIADALRPIFRDRQDFDAGASLGVETSTALDESAALILLASPAAERSKYVNEEVRLFRSRHPDRPLIPLIVDGVTGDPETECFPPALRFAIAPDGSITDAPVDVLAPDDVYRRAERERRRQNRLRAAVAAVMVALAVAGGAFSWLSHQRKQTHDEVAALVDKRL